MLNAQSLPFSLSMMLSFQRVVETESVKEMMLKPLPSHWKKQQKHDVKIWSALKNKKNQAEGKWEPINTLDQSLA